MNNRMKSSVKKDPYMGFDPDFHSTDEEWIREGVDRIREAKRLQERLERRRVERERWLVERKRCEYCNFYFWPHEIEYHYSYCRERW